MLFTEGERFFSFGKLRMRIIGPKDKDSYASAVGYCQNIYAKNL